MKELINVNNDLQTISARDLHERLDINSNFTTWVRSNGYLIKRHGTDYNMPTQRSMVLGLFKIKETTINKSDGSVAISKTVKVTGKGQEYFINKFIKR